MLEPQYFSLNFAQGVDTKTDPWQVPIGRFLKLENSVFDKGGRLTKRSGYQQITGAPSIAPYLVTLNDNLTTISNAVNAYDADTKKWITKGSYYPCSLKTLPLIRNAINQIQCDAVIAPNGLVCTVYSETQNGATAYKYAIAASLTGQNVVEPTLIPATGGGTITGSPRVFLVGTYFIIVFTNVITATPHLQYICITSTNPDVVTTPQDIASAYAAFSTVAWDAASFNNTLFVAYNSTTGGQAVHIAFLTQATLVAGGTPNSSTTIPTFEGTSFSLCVDSTVTNPLIYVSFYSSNSSTGYTMAVDTSLNTIFAPQQIIATGAFINLASAAQNNVCTVFSEAINAYSYDSGIPTHFINSVTVSSTGTVGSTVTIVRSVGIASKAFILDSVVYLLTVYQSPFQNTYFLINGSDSLQAAPLVVAKLAYENGGGYLTLGIPNISVYGTTVFIPYLNKDFISSLTTQNNTQQLTQGGVYSQTGIQLAEFTIGLPAPVLAVETASSLQIGGGFLWQYDAYLPVEQNFFLWPDSVEVTWSDSGGSMVANPQGWVNGFPSYYYQVIYSWSDNQGNIHRSAPSIPVPVTLGADASTTGSVVVNIPTLRLTYKTANPLKIEIYRWSVAQQVYHMVTSLTAPVLNSLTVDSIAFTDTLADNSISGNAIIYTEGGVLEDINAPASSIMALYDARLWLVDAEDPNLLWFSKQVIEATPVEMSDLLTVFVAPSTAVQGSTGPVTALYPMDDKLIIFKKDAIYYLNGAGQGPDNTGENNGYSQPIFITSVVGCTNQKSIVMSDVGLLFQSDKGIWLLNRYNLQATYIGAPVEDFTKFDSVNNVQPVVQSAVSVPQTNQLRFTLSTGVTLMYDYYFQQWGTFGGVPAVSSCIYQSLHTFLNSLGQVYQENPGSYLDGTDPVLMSFETSWIQIASLQGFQRAHYFYPLAQFLSPYFLTFGVSYNFNDSLFHTSTLYPKKNTSIAVPSPFGDQPAPFGTTTDVAQNRVFFKRQKCQSFKITMQENFDYSAGVTAGAGFVMSGLSMRALVKRGLRPIPASSSVG